MSIAKSCLGFVLLFSTVGLSQEIGVRKLSRQDSKSLSNNTVTLTTFKKGDTYYVYSGGDGGTIDVFSINKQGLLNSVSKHQLSDSRGPARGMIAESIQGRDFLFVGNKGGNSVEVFNILENGSLERTFLLKDTDETHLGVVITLRVVHMDKCSYLFVGGLESTPGLSCFKIHSDGKLTHVQSIKDNDKIHTDGIIGMYSHKIGKKTFLFTGGFQDNGVSSFRVGQDGTFKNVSNIRDNTVDRYLTGTYPVNGVRLGDNYYVIVGHRHHKYYKRGAGFIKNMDFVYHGDGVSVFKVDKKGVMTPHFILKNNSTTQLGGQTRIEILKTNDKEALVAIGTRDDESIQLCEMNEEGELTPVSYLKTGFPMYYGLGSLRIHDELFFIAGSVRFDLKKIVSYKVGLSSLDSDKILKHIVNLRFKESATSKEIDMAIARFAGLADEIPQISHMEWGENNSTEGQSKGFTHGFILSFNNEDAREIYLFHKAHLALVEDIGPIISDVMVMDFWAPK